ncbi:type I-C CRISPR-associated endonuclease Cas1c [Pseudogemmobacter blasticus]|uniref:CRISPR-associated endonuclease Cas1 n=1 Tax=Fuscovulum blasticum DSM 2131 TaxID=1188250 RepID=A0A2T4J5A5_FUSBL|nr:type I-C CRISPR-associated endonuclease Cas1c [Fuscovulum blasticum]PTE13079.1 subtype I-C CRISPR-associated endonuclease Cas1 [Fuscovulum blasticum DSM 2131]
MKKLLNTAYVTSEGAALHKDGENLVAMIDGAEKSRVPLHMLASVVAFGPVLVTPALIGACAERGITLVLLDRSGRFQARVEGPAQGNVLLRRAQYRLAETGNDRGADIVRSFVLAKIANQRAVLRRAIRDHAAGPGLEEATERMAQILRRVQLSDRTTDQLRGSEGEAANLYFAVFDRLIRSPDAALRWTGRSRRPPLDAMNALLSFLYTMLTHDCRSACESVGLDPAVGFLHRDRPGRPSLALDLMEELRAPLADRLALSLVNRRQLRAGDFRQTESGAVLLTDEGRKTVLTAWQERKREERQHAFLDEKAPLGLVPHLQAQLLARHLRGDMDAYPPWFWT